VTLFMKVHFFVKWFSSVLGGNKIFGNLENSPDWSLFEQTKEPQAYRVLYLQAINLSRNLADYKIIFST